MNHTPGPWKVGCSLFDKTRVTCVATGHSVLLESSRMFSREETEANMRLCAAAPDLLEICEALLDVIPNDTMSLTQDLAISVWDETKALHHHLETAIAKAKGEL